MADITKLEDLVDPQVLADMIIEKLKAKISVIGYAKLDTTLSGRAGSEITVPKRKFEGMAVEVGEGEEIPIRKLIDGIVKYAIKKVGIGTEVTDEAIVSGLGDPVADSVMAIVNSILAKLDVDAMTELLKSDTVLADDGELDYEAIVNGVDLFDEEEISDKVCEMFSSICTFAEDVYNSSNYELIDMLEAFIQENYRDEDMSLLLLAEHFNLTTGYISRIFKKCRQVNFKDYLSAYRIEKATEIMNIMPDVRISELAKQVGYDNVQRFVRNFKKLKQVSPSEYREKIKEKIDE